MKERLDKISNLCSVEVIAHAGNIRACVFGTLTPYSQNGKYIVHSAVGANSIIFTDDDVTKIVNHTQHHKVIYIS